VTQPVPSGTVHAFALSTRQIRGLGFGTLIAIIAIMSASAYYQTVRVQRQLDIIDSDYRKPLEATDELLTDFVEVRGLMTAFVIEEQTDVAPILTATGKLIDDAQALQEMTSESAPMQILEGFISTLKEYRTAMVAYSNELQISRTSDSVRAWERTLLGLEKRGHKNGGDLKEYMAARIAAKEAEIRSLGISLQRWNLLFGVVGVLSGFLVAFLLQRALRQPVERLIKIAQRVAEGDLTRSVESSRSDEIGILAQAVGAMVESLRRMVLGIRDTFQALDTAALDLEESARKVSRETGFQTRETASVSSSVETMSKKFQELTGSVKEMTEGLDQSSVSVQEMSASIKTVHNMADTMAREVDAITSSLVEMNQVTGQSVELLNSLAKSSHGMADTVRRMAGATETVGIHAQESKNLAETVTQMAARQGIPAVNNVLEVTRKNKDLVDNYSRVVFSLGERSASIGEILDVIREVAQQTNLLSLNAAIIANQAGEHGRAFSVVAEEIGKLSETTATNVKKIASVVKTVRTEVDEAVNLVAEVKEQADTSIASAEKAGQILEEIGRMSEKSTGMATEIAATSVTQVKQSADILKLVEENVSQVAQINRAAEEQKRGSDLIVNSASELSSIAEHLKRSTEEQSQASTMVAKTIASTHLFSKEVMTVMEEEDAKTREIAKSLQVVSQVAETTLASMNSLMSTVNKLRELASKLGPEMARFRVSGDNGLHAPLP